MTESKHNAAAPKGETVWLDDDPVGEVASADRVLSIDNVADMFGVSRMLLFYYELRGLARRRQRRGGVRVYSWADCERIAFIVKCQRAGLRLRDIASIVKATDADDVAAGPFLAGQERCMALVDGLERRRKVIDEALAELAHTHSLLSAKLGGVDRGGEPS